jgi:hypothetical protein
MKADTMHLVFFGPVCNILAEIIDLAEDFDELKFFIFVLHERLDFEDL